jgi:hypothetical protein
MERAEEGSCLSAPPPEHKYQACSDRSRGMEDQIRFCPILELEELLLSVVVVNLHCPSAT